MIGAMSHETPKKKKRSSLLPEALAATVALGIHMSDGKTDAKQTDMIGDFIQQDIGKFSEHDPRGAVEDRRLESQEHAHRPDYSELEPDGPINDDLATSQLAIDAGTNSIGKSPLEIMRERKAQAEARAKILAAEAKARWQREQEKKRR